MKRNKKKKKNRKEYNKADITSRKKLVQREIYVKGRVKLNQKYDSNERSRRSVGKLSIEYFVRSIRALWCRQIFYLV